MIENLPERFTNYTFETYPVSASTQAGFEAIRYWAITDDTSGLRSAIYIYGRPGVGKTGLGAAMLNHWTSTNDSDPAVFRTTAGLLAAIRRTFREGNDDIGGDGLDPLEDAQYARYLMLDDFGVESATPWAVEKLFELVNHRYSSDDGMNITIFTSNYSLPELKDRIARQVDARAGGPRRIRGSGPSEEGQVVAARIIGRVAEMTDVVHLDGPDLRDPIARAGVDAVGAAVDLINRRRS